MASSFSRMGPRDSDGFANVGFQGVMSPNLSRSRSSLSPAASPTQSGDRGAKPNLTLISSRSNSSVDLGDEGAKARAAFGRRRSGSVLSGRRPEPSSFRAAGVFRSTRSTSRLSRLSVTSTRKSSKDVGDDDSSCSKSSKERADNRPSVLNEAVEVDVFDSEAMDEEGSVRGHGGGRRRRMTIRGSQHEFLLGGLYLLPDDERISNVFLATVLLDFLWFGFEIDSKFNLWLTMLGHIFSVFYAVELAYRLHIYTDEIELAVLRRENQLIILVGQTLLVACGLIDICAAILGLSAIRCVLRYVRLFRMIWVFCLSEVLGRFVCALAVMMQQLAWPFCIMGLTCYLTAIMIRIRTDDEGAQDLEMMYPDTSTVTFLMFQVVTMDNWHQAIDEMAKENWFWNLFFISFIVFTSYVMVSIMTATVCDQIIKSTAMADEYERDMLDMAYREFSIFLRDVFLEADTDGNGVMDKEEFQALIADPLLFDKMEELGVVISKEELENTFDMLDVDESGELSVEEFTAGLSQMQRNLGIKHVLALNYAMQHFFKKTEKELNAVHAHKIARFHDLEAKWDSISRAALVNEAFSQYVDKLFDQSMCRHDTVFFSEEV